MGQRLPQRPSYGCLYRGDASSARRHSRPPPAAHRAAPPSPAVTGRHRPTAAQPRSVPRNAARAAWASWAAAPAAPATIAMNFNVYSHAPMDLGYWVASPSKHRARWAAHRARRAAAARSVPRTRRVRPRKARLFSSSPVARSRPRRIRSRSTSRARLYIEPPLFFTCIQCGEYIGKTKHQTCRSVARMHAWSRRRRVIGLRLGSRSVTDAGWEQVCNHVTA